MGGAYFVPRSVKGETRLLFIFTIKSFVLTVAFGLIGALIWFLLSNFITVSLVVGLVLVGITGAIGYVIGAVTIPDSPVMGPLRKAGGENISDILLRLLVFRGKKKIYLYNYKRGEIKSQNKGGKK